MKTIICLPASQITSNAATFSMTPLMLFNCPCIFLQFFAITIIEYLLELSFSPIPRILYLVLTSFPGLYPAYHM